MRAGFWQIVIVLILVLILFGHNKIPEMMRNLAGGINTFKKELKEDDSKTDVKRSQPKARRAAVGKTRKPAQKKTTARSSGVAKKRVSK